MSNDALSALRAVVDCGAIMVRGDVPLRFRKALAHDWINHLSMWDGTRFRHVFTLKIDRPYAINLLATRQRAAAA